MESFLWKSFQLFILCGSFNVRLSCLIQHRTMVWYNINVWVDKGPLMTDWIQIYLLESSSFSHKKILTASIDTIFQIYIITYHKQGLETLKFTAFVQIHTQQHRDFNYFTASTSLNFWLIFSKSVTEADEEIRPPYSYAISRHRTIEPSFNLFSNIFCVNLSKQSLLS